MSAQTRWGDLIVEGDARRRELREHHGNGVDGVEVHEGGRRLLVYFLDHAPERLHHGNIRIDAPDGGRPVRAVEVRRISEADRELEDRLIVELDHPGSTGPYRLRVVEAGPDGTPGWVPHRGIDPRFAGATFVFDIDEPRPPIISAPAGTPGYDDTVTYLDRDYAGLRQLMLDRIGVTMPEWTEHDEPDIWITLIELLAYIGDDLSYYEDAVATEAYLQTARNRISVRRHARLVDYRLSEGCTARSWVCVDVNAPVSVSLEHIRFAAAGAYIGDGPPLIVASSFPVDQLTSFQQYSPLTAQPGSDGLEAVAHFRPARNAIELWSWGETDSHLTTGATSAVLKDGAPPSGKAKAPRRALELGAGDVLILEETSDPLTLGVGPADPTHRQAVRLTEVRRTFDWLYEQPLLEVRWAPEDALAFDLAVTAGGNQCCQASGNVVLVANGVPAQGTVQLDAASLGQAGLGYSTPFPDPDVVAHHQARILRGLYGAWRREVSEWLSEAFLGTPLSKDQLETLRLRVGAEELERLGLSGPRRGLGEPERAALEALALLELLARADGLLAGRRRRLDVLAELAAADGPLEDVLLDELREDWGTELTAGLAAGRPGSWGPAAIAVTQDPRAALPVLELADAAGDLWSPAPDLIGVAPTDRAFVAEIDDQGIAQLRINNPPQAASLTATYWLGNGTAGNAEIEAINALVWAPPAGDKTAPPAGLTLVRNPLAVTGGIDPETTAVAKLAIPGAFMDGQPRALTAEDYAALAAAVPGVRRAAAELRFTGSLSVIEVAIQPELGEDPTDALLDEVWRALEPARRIGHLVRVLAPRYRPLVLSVEVVLATSALRFQASRELARLLSNGWTASGAPALFNPSQLAFAAPLYSSPIVAAVQSATGVDAVTLTRFGFLDQGPGAVAVSSELKFGTLEIARLDNDELQPEHGYARVYLEGGR